MGAGFNVDKGGNHRINGRREFNWWWDPEAARMAMSAPWKKITITPVDISVKTTLSDDVKARVAKSSSPAAQYLTKYAPIGKSVGGGGYMWDEICGGRPDRSVDHHQAAGAVRQHRHRPRRQLRPDDLRRGRHSGPAGPAADAPQDGALVAGRHGALGPRSSPLLRQVRRTHEQMSMLKSVSPDVCGCASRRAVDGRGPARGPQGHLRHRLRRPAAGRLDGVDSHAALAGAEAARHHDRGRQRQHGAGDFRRAARARDRQPYRRPGLQGRQHPDQSREDRMGGHGARQVVVRRSAAGAAGRVREEAGREAERRRLHRPDA